MPKPAHILAKPGDIAKIVVTSGDPERTEQIARMLDKPKLVNKNRGFTTYTGSYNGVRLTVAAHGIGGPSASVVYEELKMLGAKVIVRFGTAGGLIDDLAVGEFVVPVGAAYLDGSLRSYVQDGVLPPVPDFVITANIIRACAAARVSFTTGLVFSSDAFYEQDPKFLAGWTKRGVIAVEMECATLFTLAYLRGFRAASLLLLSNSLVRKGEKALATAEKLKPYVERGGILLLEALTNEAVTSLAQ